ncbi:MAG: DUF1667 domain-containing protein [Clostridia bacterium]|nr:DUF1667 domain-containing protein [Clostridia bacterium]
MNITCINCPMGCQMVVDKIDGVVTVKGNTCPRGRTYGIQEYTLPKRMVTSLVRVNDGRVLSVKTSDSIPKDKIIHCLNSLKDVIVAPPIHIGDCIVANICNLGVDLVATKNIL